MNTNTTDSQKIRIGNEIAKPYTRQNPAYGMQHWQTGGNMNATEKTKLLHDMRQEQGRIADANDPIWWLYSFVLGLLGCGGCVAILYFIFGG